MTKTKLNEEWRGKLRSIFESATTATIFEMPETDIEVAPVDPTDLDAGAGALPVDPAAETVTLTKDALKQLLVAVSKEEAEEVGDDLGDDLEGDDTESLDDTLDDSLDDEEPVSEEAEEELPAVVEPVDADPVDDVEGGLDTDAIASDIVDGAMDDEDAEISALVDKVFALAAGGTFGAEHVADAIAELNPEGDSDEFPIDGEETDDLGDEEAVEEPVTPEV